MPISKVNKINNLETSNLAIYIRYFASYTKKAWYLQMNKCTEK